MKGVLRLALVCLAVLGFGCQPAGPTSAPTKAQVLASTTVLADIARHIAGDLVIVDSLLPAGADPHEYQATPQDVQKISHSRLLILNGLEYESFIQPLLENAGGARLTITATSGLEPLKVKDQNGQEQFDPHMWLDPNLVTGYVENIRAGLAQADPENAAAYQKNADAYIQELESLDAWIKQQVDQVPEERRLLVTNHGSLAYFARRYGFTVVTQVIPGVSTETGSSARQLAAAIDSIRQAGAPAVFLGELENRDLAEQISAETGILVVDDLYLESLSSGPPAAGYIEMMKHNVERIVQALR